MRVRRCCGLAIFGKQRGYQMSIKAGDKVPTVTLKHKTADGIDEISTSDLFSGKKVVVFAVPGAFTPTCSAKHLPGFVNKAADLKAKGVDTIACVSVNDAFVMDAWGQDQNVGDKVMMLGRAGWCEGTGYCENHDFFAAE